MQIWFALLLGIIQGFTEFLPVSSSGHLSILQRLFGTAPLSDYILFNLVCHLGTLVATIVLLFDEIRHMTRQKFVQITLATLPLFPLVFIVKEIKTLIDTPLLLGFDFMITGGILFLGSYFSKEERRSLSKRGALLVGLSQTLALLPGISRSGTTISCGKIIGLTDKEAIRFSFLLAIPTILGASFLESIALWKGQNSVEIGVAPYLAAFFASLICGLAALKFLQTLGMKRVLRYFACYCTIVGVLCLWLS